jgi:hypothetical protein
MSRATSPTRFDVIVVKIFATQISFEAVIRLEQEHGNRNQ